MGKAGFFLILYDSALSTCCAMNGMLRDGCHFETRKDSVANARVVDVVVCIMMGGNLCDVFVLFQNLIAGSHCTNKSLSACLCFRFLLSSLFSMSLDVIPTYACLELMSVLSYTTCL